jgi:hypothetical protein
MLASGLFPSYFVYIDSVMRAVCSARLVLIFFTPVAFREQQPSTNCEVAHYQVLSVPFVTSSLLGSNAFHSILFAYILDLLFLFSDQRPNFTPVQNTSLLADFIFSFFFCILV